MSDVVLKRFEQADEVRTFDKGRFELVRFGSVVLGRASYEPGWRWSVDVGAKLGKTSCDVAHVGIVLAGRATAAMSCISRCKSSVQKTTRTNR